jgi:hypothetical protein
MQRIGLIIADFEMSYSTSFQHTARVKYEVDFNTSNVDSLITNLSLLKDRVINKQHNNKHVGLEITVEDVFHVENLLNQILERYKVVFGVLPKNRKIYTINQKLRESEEPTAKDLAKQVLGEIFSQEKPEKLSRKEQIERAAKLKSKQRALDAIKRNSAKKK